MSERRTPMSDHADIVREALRYSQLPNDTLAVAALDALVAERDEAKSENSRLRGQLSEIAHTNAPVIRDLGARAEAAEAEGGSMGAIMLTGGIALLMACALAIIDNHFRR
jgi:hypothetical protein